MTHFTVLVIGDNPEDQLAPFHEFECTGRDDQYVSDVDITAAARVEYMADKRTMLVVPPGAVATTAIKYELFNHPTHGTLISLYEDCFKVQPTNRHLLTGDKYVAPEGYVQLTVPCNEIMPFSKWVEYYYEYQTVPHNTLFTKPYPKDLKYGYVLLDAAGEVSAVIKRTNCEKWEWVDEEGKTVGYTIGDEDLPFVQRVEGSRDKFLLDNEGRLVHLLQSLYCAQQQGAQNYGTASNVAPEIKIRDNATIIPSHVSGTRGSMRDLSRGVGNKDGGVCDRSLSFEWCGAIPFMLPMQHGAWQCEGQQTYLVGNGEVSRRTLTKRLIGGNQWDWFELGGRWAGKFKLRAGCSGVAGSKGLGMESIRPGWVSAARLGDIDLEGMVFEERAKASKQFDDYWAVASKYPKAYGRKECQDALRINLKGGSGGVVTVSPLSELCSQLSVNKFYNEQPAVKALQETLGINLDCYIDAFGHDRDAYIHLRCSSVMPTFALLYKGEWTARDTYWGADSVEQVPQLEWNMIINDLLMTLPADTLISVYDCHI